MAQDTPYHLQFVKRPFLDVSPPGPGRKYKIMTYNMLAQALIQRKLFPLSGASLRWKPRSQVLLLEIQHYDCDVICLQEVDYVQYMKFWKPSFLRLGCLTEFYRYGDKTHGLVVGYKKLVFKAVDVKHCFAYDEILTEKVASCGTTNVGMLVKLEHVDGGGIVVGTTHLYWRPEGTFDRARQTYVILNQVETFCRENQLAGWPVFFAGDFNTMPQHSPYLLMTKGSKTAESETVLEDSLKARETAEGTVEALEKLFNDSSWKAVSLYGLEYEKVDGANCKFQEPAYTNWAHTWRGCLDYVFYITNSDLKPLKIKVNKLLKVPSEEEFGPLGLPQPGKYPSDHVCLVVEVEIAL